LEQVLSDKAVQIHPAARFAAARGAVNLIGDPVVKPLVPPPLVIELDIDY
jgi:hypothetical protein